MSTVDLSVHNIEAVEVAKVTYNGSSWIEVYAFDKDKKKVAEICIWGSRREAAPRLELGASSEVA